MDLNQFKRLVDDKIAASSTTEKKVQEQVVLSDIGKHFPPKKTSTSLTLIRHLLHEISVRHLCDRQPLQPYLNVAQALLSALRTNGTSETNEVDWEGAIFASVNYHLHFPPYLPDELQLTTDVRAQIVSKSVIGLRAFNYHVFLPDEGGLHIPESEALRLQNDINELAKSLGGKSLVDSALRGIEATYSVKTDRFNLGRYSHTIRTNADPQLPFAFLYQLGLKFFHCPPVCGVGKTEFHKLISLLTFAVGTLNLEPAGVLSLIYARPNEILESTRSALLYDATFCLTQANPRHALVFIEWLLTHKSFQCFLDKYAFTSHDVMTAASYLLIENDCGPTSILKIPHMPFSRSEKLRLDSGKGILSIVFSHATGKVNQKLIFPPHDSEVNSAFRPLLTDSDGSLFRIPRNMAARATLNAVIDWCRNAWKSEQDFDEALGLALENFVRDQFVNHGVKIHYGEYKHKNTIRGECDMVIQTESHVIFFELKGKVLTRRSRSGDLLKALEDLTESLARPLAQAMERHAFLQEYGQMELLSGQGTSFIELGSREVLKVSVTRGELLSLHDRSYLWHYLVAGCQLHFKAEDPAHQEALDPLNYWFKKFREAAQRANEYNLSKSFPFSNCWSLSLFQLLLLLERTRSADDFVQELLRTSQIITPSQDFYNSYEYMVKLDAQR